MQFAGNAALIGDGMVVAADPARRRFFVDVTPLRDFDQFRLLFLGHGITHLGRQLTVVAAPIQVYNLTESTLAVGLLGLVQFPALLVGSVAGGALADAVDRRRLLIIAQLISAVITAGLTLNAMLAAPSVIAVFALTAAGALLFGVDQPTRAASVPRLVPAERLSSAIALTVLLTQVGIAAGPAIGGIVIAKFDVAIAFGFDALTFIVAAAVLWAMKPLPPADDGAKADWKSFKEGLGFIRSRGEVQGFYIIDIGAMVLGMPRALFPELGLTVLGNSQAVVGLLFAAPGIGALLAAATSGWVARVRRAGVAAIVVVVIWGLCIAGFGFSTNLTLALVLLAVGGGADALSSVFRTTILQMSTPDRLRGRLSAVQIAVVAGGPRLGDLEAGVVAALTNARVAAWSGGLGAAVSALLVGAFLPRFRNWTPPPAEDADPEAVAPAESK